MIALRAYPTLLRIGFAAAVAYRAELFVWMLTTTMPLVSLALWSAVAETGAVGRFGPRDFVAYFLAALVVRQLSGSWLVWTMNYEIKNGTLAQRLLKPIHPLIAYSAENLAAIPLRTVLCLPVIVVAVVWGDVSHDPVILTLWLVSLAGAWFINFFTMAAIASLAFFVESSTSIFEVWLVAFMLLSGYLVPLELFPGWARTLADFLPFRYTLGFPSELIVGRLDRLEALRQLAFQWAWAAVSGIVALWVFRAGIRRFSAFGG